MSKEGLHDKLASVKWREDTKQFRKKLSILILIILIFGYIFLFLFNAFVAVSASGIRIETKDFDKSTGSDNQTIGIEGSVIIHNDHWYSLDINDLIIKMEVMTEDKEEVYDKKIEKEVIPRLKTTEIELDFSFSPSDIDPDINATLASLGKSDKLFIKFSVSVRYVIYITTFELTVRAEFDD